MNKLSASIRSLSKANRRSSAQCNCPRLQETGLVAHAAASMGHSLKPSWRRPLDPEGGLYRGPRFSARAPAPQSAFDNQAFRRKLVGLANQELARWGSGAIKETDPRTRRVLQDYWKTGAGVSYRADQLGDPSFQSAHPWSAAFISWVMRTAGAGDAFKYSASHSVYTRAAKDNRNR